MCPTSQTDGQGAAVGRASRPPTGVLQFSTARIPVGHRIEHWAEHNMRALIGLDIRTLDGAPLEAAEVNLYFPALRFARVRGSSQIIERSARLVSECPTGDVAFFFALGGEAFFYYDRGMIMLKPGQAVLYDADEPYLRGFSNGVQELVLTVPREEYLRMARDRPLRDPVVFEFAAESGAPGADPAATNLAALIHATLLRPDRDLLQVEQEAFGLVEQLVARALGTDRQSAYRRALEVVRRRFAETGLDRAQVAAAVGISERQLTRLFSARGETFAEHLLEHRLQAAEAMIVSRPDERIADVARRCGFATASHFTRRFRERTGVTPTEVQRAAQAHDAREGRAPFLTQDPRAEGAAGGLAGAVAPTLREA